MAYYCLNRNKQDYLSVLRQTCGANGKEMWHLNMNYYYTCGFSIKISDLFLFIYQITHFTYNLIFQTLKLLEMRLTTTDFLPFA